MPRHERTWFPFPMTAAYAIVAFVGLLGVVAAVLARVGVTPPLPDGGPTPSNLLAWSIPAAALLTGALALLGRGMSGGFVARWFTLSSFAWAIAALSVPLGSSALAASEVVQPARLAAYLVALTLIPSLAAGAVCAATFVPGEAHRGFQRRFHAWRATRASHHWAWRLPAGFLACAAALALATFALAPLVGGSMELDAVALQFLRGIVLAAVALPVVVLWERTGLQLLGTLAFALFAPAAVGGWVLGHWLDRTQKTIGALELLATAGIVAGALVVLWLGRRADDEIDALNAAELAPAA